MTDLLKELEEIIYECSEPDWDFEGSLPLDKTSIEECKNFINWLLINWLPEKLDGGVVPFSNGSVGLDFYDGNNITTILFEKNCTVWCRSVNNKVESGSFDKETRYLNYFLLTEVLKMFL